MASASSRANFGCVPQKQRRESQGLLRRRDSKRKIVSNESSPVPTTVTTIATDVSEVASIAAEIAPLAGPYGVIASTVLTFVQVLAKDAPQAYAVIAKAFTSADPTQTDYDALIAEIEALQIDP